MAKKLLAVLLAVLMIVPMAISPAFAEEAETKTFTESVFVDTDSGLPYAALLGTKYPQRPYTYSTEFYLDWFQPGDDAGHGVLVWTVDGCVSFGYDFLEEGMFLSYGGRIISDKTEFIKIVPYVLEADAYYKFTFKVSSTHFEAYVNGELVLEADKEEGKGDFWAPGKYLLSWPANVGAYVVENTVTYDNGYVISSGSGANAFADWAILAGFQPGSIAEQGVETSWDGVAPIYVDPVSDDELATMAQYTIDAIDAIGDVVYNEWKSVDVTDGMKYSAIGRPIGLDWIDGPFQGPAKVDVAFKVIAANPKGANKDSVIGGSFGINVDGHGVKTDDTGYLGYNLTTKKFFIGDGMSSPYGTHDPADPSHIVAYSDEYILEEGKMYNMSLVFDMDRVYILMNGVEVLSSDNYKFADCNVHSKHGFGLYCNFVDFYMASFTVTHIYGDVVMPAGDHVTNGEISFDQAFTAEAYFDSFDAIAKAETAYSWLPEEAKALVTNYEVLVAAKEAYNALIPTGKTEAVEKAEALIAAIGVVTLDSGDAIAAAKSAYNALSNAEKTMVENYAVLTAADSYYKVLLKVDNVEKTINAIGTVTVKSGDAIANAKAAYNALEPSEKEMVANYDVLTAAEVRYASVLKIAAVKRTIAAIGDKVYKNAPNPQLALVSEAQALDCVFGAGDGYSNMEMDSSTAMNSDYTVQFDFQYVSNGANARFAGGGQNFNAGYNFDIKTWCIGTCSPWGNPTPVEGSTYTEMELDPDHIYTYKLEVRGNRITLYIDGNKVAETKTLVKVPGNYFIFYPANCAVKVANYSFWYFRTSYNEPAIEENLSGEALKASKTWTSRNDNAGWAFDKPLTTFVVPETVDSLAAIEKAEAAYAALTDAEKAEVANADVLAADRALYDKLTETGVAQATTFAVGNVTVNASNIKNFLAEDGSFLVPVSVKVSDLPKAGIASATFGVSVEGATIASITAGAGVNADMFQVGPDGNTIVWVDDKVIAADAEFAVITVAVPADVVAGTEIAVILTASEDADDFNTLEGNYVPAVADGKVTFTVNGAVARLEKVAAVAPTCESAGSVEYWLDAVTGIKYADDKATTVIDDIAVPALGHTLVKVDAKAPSFEEAGNIEYWYCSVCNKIFADAEGANEITIEDTVIPAIVAGDVDADGSVTLKDVIIIMRYLAGWKDVEVNTAVADFNADGRVNNKDVIMILIAIANGDIA